MLTLYYIAVYGKTPIEADVPPWAIFLATMSQFILLAVLYYGSKRQNNSSE